MLYELKWIDRDNQVQTASMSGHAAESIATGTAEAMLNFGITDCVQIKEYERVGRPTGRVVHLEPTG